METQFILTACLVNFGFIPVQSFNQATTSSMNDETLENFQNLFDSIIRNDAEKSEVYRRILNQEISRDRQASDAMKEQLRTARHRNVYKPRYVHKNSNIPESIVLTKRQTKTNSPLESASMKEFSKNIEALTKLFKPQTESNPIRDREDLEQRALEAAKSFERLEKKLFPTTTERDLEKEEFVKKKKTGSVAFSKIPDVEIDESGVFKYILVELTDKNGKKRNIVRGHRRFEDHDDIMEDLQRDVDNRFGVKCRYVGGGLIDHQPEENFMKVYGHSETFENGQPIHKITAELLETTIEYKDYDIVWTNDD